MGKCNEIGDCMGYIHVWDIMGYIMEIVDITEYIMRKGWLNNR